MLGTGLTPFPLPVSFSPAQWRGVLRSREGQHSEASAEGPSLNALVPPVLSPLGFDSRLYARCLKQCKPGTYLALDQYLLHETIPLARALLWLVPPGRDDMMVGDKGLCVLGFVSKAWAQI